MLHRLALVSILAYLAVVVLATSVATAQSVDGAVEAESPQPEPPPVDPGWAEKLATPQATLQTLIDAVDNQKNGDAAKCLDLSGVDKDTAKAKGIVWAYKLREVLSRMGVDEYFVVAHGSSAEPYHLGSDLLHRLSGRQLEDANQIVLWQGADKLWRFSAETVAAIDSLYDTWNEIETSDGPQESKGAKPFALWLPELFEGIVPGIDFLLPDYMWICLAILIFLGFFADFSVRFILNRLTKAWFEFVHAEKEYQARRGLWKPIGLFVQALVWYLGTKLLDLPEAAMSILLVGLKFFAVVAAVWAAFRLIDLLSVFLSEKAELTATKFDDLLIPLTSKTLKTFAIVVGLLMCAEAFNLPITPLLGGLGLGGMALALASKDTVSNLFGSFTVLVDRPFEIGDWIVTENVEGSVETVGFRSTRVRTFYNSLITVPNSRLTTTVVDNMGKRRYRRIKTTLGLQYDTSPEQIDAFCEGVRELIRRHPYTRKDYYHVYFNQFSDSSLDVLLYCFLECPDWSIELRERHRLFIDILRLADALGCSFAFPTRTLHMIQETHSGNGLPEELSRPEATGRRLAEQIAGPPVTRENRPGGVEFPMARLSGSDGPDGDDGGGDGGE